jgi:hypothetical protein
MEPLNSIFQKITIFLTFILNDAGVRFSIIRNITSGFFEMISGRASKVVSIFFPNPVNQRLKELFYLLNPYFAFSEILSINGSKWVPWGITLILSGGIS